jgi:lipoprotein-anchoring transpeptidase ErfK/SrfK
MNKFFLLCPASLMILATTIPIYAQSFNKNPITVLEELELKKIEQQKRLELDVKKKLTVPKPASPLPNTVLQRKKLFGYQIPQDAMKASLSQTIVFIDKSELKLWVIDRRRALQTSRIMVGRNYWPTPSGNFNIYNKERNISLIGQDYNAPVSYWMPFLHGYGLHDANWRPDSHFGNTSIQPNKGSHGCINLPPSIASTIYSLVQIGTPVIIIE